MAERAGWTWLTPQGPGKVLFQLVRAHVMALSGLRAWWRRAVAMLSQPVSRRIEIAVLRRVAMTWVAWPVRTWERSSS